MRKLTEQLRKKKSFRWLLRILIPVSVLLLGLALGRSSLLILVLLLLVPPFNLLFLFVLERVLAFYGVRDSLPDGSPARPWATRAISLFLGASLLALLIFAFSQQQTAMHRVGALTGAFFVGCHLFLLLEPSAHSSEAAAHPQSPPQTRRDLVGQYATVITALRPVGKIDVNGAIHDAVAEGEFIDKGATVRIIGSSLNQLKVRLHAEQQENGAVCSS